jgi:hypothetical protein
MFRKDDFFKNGRMPQPVYLPSGPDLSDEARSERILRKEV